MYDPALTENDRIAKARERDEAAAKAAGQQSAVYEHSSEVMARKDRERELLFKLARWVVELQPGDPAPSGLIEYARLLLTYDTPS